MLIYNSPAGAAVGHEVLRYGRSPPMAVERASPPRHRFREKNHLVSDHNGRDADVASSRPKADGRFRVSNANKPTFSVESPTADSVALKKADVTRRYGL